MLYIYIDIHIYVHMCVCMYVYMYVKIYIYIRVYIYMCIYAYIYICIYVYVHLIQIALSKVFDPQYAVATVSRIDKIIDFFGRILSLL